MTAESVRLRRELKRAIIAERQAERPHYSRLEFYHDLRRILATAPEQIAREGRLTAGTLRTLRGRVALLMANKIAQGTKERYTSPTVISQVINHLADLLITE